jgi:hypothetical protein
VWVMLGPFQGENAEAVALQVDYRRFGSVLGDSDQDGFHDVAVHGSGLEGVAFFGRPQSLMHLYLTSLKPRLLRS